MFTFNHIITTVTLILFYVGAANGFWRMTCFSASGIQRMDPIVEPDTPSSHVHTIKGSDGFSWSVSDDASELLDSNCSTCSVSNDHSVYWTVALYFQHDDGTFEPVAEEFPFNGYYFERSGLTAGGQQQTVEAFPNGFRMVSGMNDQRTEIPRSTESGSSFPAQDYLAQQALGFNCLHYDVNPPENSLAYHQLRSKSFIDSTCTDGVRFELMFPSCWNGQNDSPDHKSHVAFPSGVQGTGDCPVGYDRRLPALFFETKYDTPAFAGKSGQFVLANGDTTGYGYHGDFIAAWTDNVLEQAVNNAACSSDASTGQLEDCPAFAPNIVPSASLSSCSFAVPSQLAGENPAASTLSSLPGSNSVYNGVAPASSTAASSSATTQSSVAAYQAEVSDSSTSTTALPSSSSTSVYVAPSSASSSTTQGDNAPMAPYVAITGGAVKEAEYQQSAPSSTSTSVSSTITVAPNAPPAGASGLSTLSTMTYTSGREVLEVVVEEEDVTVTMPATTTAAAAKKRSVHEHQRRHGHGTGYGRRR